MPRHSRKFHAPLVTGFLAAGACIDDEPEAPRTCVEAEDTNLPDLPLAYATEHLDIYVDVGEFVCAGSAQDYERFVSYVAEQLEIDIQRRIPFYAMDSTVGYCSKAGACVTPNGTVYSQPYATYHELVHGVACELRTGAPAILAEGLAVSFEPDPFSGSGLTEEIAELTTSEFGMFYFDAGHFVRWLLENGSPETFKEVYRTASYETGVWQAIEAAYGESVAEEFASGAPRRWLRHRQCADIPLLEAAQNTWHFNATLDCQDPQTLGPYERGHQLDVEPGAMYQSFLIDVDAPETFRVDRTGAPSLVMFERCPEEHQFTEEDEDAWTRSTVFFAGQDYGLIDLEPGRWRFNVLVDHGPAVEVSLSIAPDPG